MVSGIPNWVPSTRSTGSSTGIDSGTTILVLTSSRRQSGSGGGSYRDDGDVRGRGTSGRGMKKLRIFSASVGHSHALVVITTPSFSSVHRVHHAKLNAQSRSILPEQLANLHLPLFGVVCRNFDVSTQCLG